MDSASLHKYLEDSLTPSLGRSQAYERAAREVEFVEKHQIKALFLGEDDYPAMLAEAPDAPKLVFTKGNLRFQGHFLSIVGTRGASDRGKQLTREFVKDLAARVPDLTIVSGLAYGIDVAAHKAALAAGIPTIIVPAHGLDRIYPSLHRNVAVEALKNGGILTEYMSETEPMQWNFVARNRIVAGLSEATVVMESRDKGGSLITADIAFGYGREVFAFPGRPSDASSAGCNQLIRKQVAGLITSADDLIKALGWDAQELTAVQTSLNDLFADLSDEETRVMEVIRSYEDGVQAGALVGKLHMTYSAVTALLFGLELKKLVRSLPGNFYKAL